MEGGRVMDISREQINLAAAAIANARIMRRGAPAVSNVLATLPKKLLDEVREDAQAALAAALQLEADRG